MVELITRYGPALVFANVLLQQLGLPIPALPTLVVAGGLAADGNFSAFAIFRAAFIACAISDTFWYGAGRLYGRRALKFLCQLTLSPDSCVRQSEYRFHRWGKLTLVLAKFVPGGSIITPPLAGAMRMNGWSFALLDGIGAALWPGVMIGVGMLFHQEIGRAIAYLQEFGFVAIAAAGLLLAGYIANRWRKRRKLYRRLRIARITVDELHRLIDEGRHPVIVDLRASSVQGQDTRFIPGALVMDLDDADRWLDQAPTDQEIIFYCRCPTEAAAASIARKLMDLGYTRVRPLLGGLDAWIAAGYEVAAPAGAPVRLQALGLNE